MKCCYPLTRTITTMLVHLLTGLIVCHNLLYRSVARLYLLSSCNFFSLDQKLILWSARSTDLAALDNAFPLLLRLTAHKKLVQFVWIRQPLEMSFAIYLVYTNFTKMYAP